MTLAKNLTSYPTRVVRDEQPARKRESTVELRTIDRRRRVSVRRCQKRVSRLTATFTLLNLEGFSRPVFC